MVITILGILAYFVMADYNGEIKRSRVRVAQETVYSELQDLKVRVESGNYTESDIGILNPITGETEIPDIHYCWGLTISEDDGFERFFTEYNAENGCDYNTKEVDATVSIASNVGIVSLNDGAFTEVDVVFYPPYGDILIDGLADDESLTIVLGAYSYNREILITPSTGNIELNDQAEE